ncbi:MAG: RluA family pseudouridine synthase [Ignavibacteria bacterium]|nr:RluA family pseudouridine synthase [Ignavibacteria bacterium]
MTIITEKNLKFEITDGKKKERLDVFLSRSIENATRSKVQQLIKAKLVQVNNKPTKPSYIPIAHDVITVTIPITPRPDEVIPENIPLNIVYEDDDLIIVNKSAGMVVHPAYGNYSGTLVNALKFYTQNLSTLNEPSRAGIVHRLDKGTSGLLVVAKNDIAHSKLSKQFSNHTIDREYWAIVWGHFKDKTGTIEANLGRSKSDRKKFSIVNSGKHAVTNYEVIEEYEFLTLVKLKLKTGRTHQIRVHLSSIGHPVFGDSTYGGRKIHGVQLTTKLKQHINNLLEIMTRQALHAKTLGFMHPTTNKFMKFDSDLPEDMKKILNILK